jgi:hypothetical protein
MSASPNWYPPLKQDPQTEVVYFDNALGFRYNVYSLGYPTTYTLQTNTYTLGNGGVATDVSSAITKFRSTMIGVVPLIRITSDNSYSPINYSFPTNNYSISVVTLEKDYQVIPQLGPSSGLYRNTGAAPLTLSYRHALIINGVFDPSGTYNPYEMSVTIPMEIKQEGGNGYLEKKINLPITITKVDTNIGIKPIQFFGALILKGEDKRIKTPNDPNNADYKERVITLEYTDAYYDLIFPEFATTTRKNVANGTPDYTNIVYYITKNNDVFDLSNDYITINGNKILFRKVTPIINNVAITIPIKFYQAASPMYKSSSQYIGEVGSLTPDTIKLKIVKSTPRFEGQTPTNNDANPATIYTLPDVNKMTTEGSFTIKLPVSNNTDPDASYNFMVSSSDSNVVKIVYADKVFTARVYLDGVATITVTQLETTNFNQKTAYFNINVFKITASIINCNTNVFYTNPYNRQFWTRFTPNCRNSDLYSSVTGAKLTPIQVDDVYDMRRKTEILKYNKNVGGLTKSQKYAKASRGELMRQIGNENKYLSQSTGAGGSDGLGPFTLVCPSTPESRARLQCGLTSACGVPGKERLLCYDPSVNLYNYKKTYEYKAGLQLTSNIPTTELTAPTNFVVSAFDVELNRITLRWDAPDSNGGYPIVGYVITYSTNNKTWDPYTSILPNGPKTGVDASYNPISGELNGNSVVFERKEGSKPILTNTVYYLSVFSGNERGLSSVPATLTFKTSSVPSIVTDFSFNDIDERKNMMIDIIWKDPTNSGTSNGGYYGPPITSYNLYYRENTVTTWSNINISATTVIATDTLNVKRYILRNVENEKKYNLKIEPINSVGVGPESTILTARTLMKPRSPLNVTAYAKYGKPSSTVTISQNYIVVNWGKPDNGGNLIKYYNVTVTNIDSTASISQTFTYNITSTNANDNTFTINVTRFTTAGSIGTTIIPGTYSIVLSAYNGYLTSESSATVKVAILPTSAKPSISDIVGYYNSTGLDYARLIFTISERVADGIYITNIRVNGLTSGFDNQLTDIYGKSIGGTGEHTINIPTTYSDKELLVVGNEYKITLTITYSSLVESTSEIFTYTPEIRYLSA